MITLAHFLATCGPCGKAKFAPGTWGSVVGLVVAFGLGHHQLWLALSLPIVFVVSVWSSNVVSKSLGDKDPSCVVIDEVCGMMISLLWIPMRWQTYLIGFVLFRLFDIVKPPPIRLLEKVPKGFGIVLDDVLAGVYANITLQLLIYYAHL